jgi:matrixin/pre-peptidase
MRGMSFSLIQRRRIGAMLWVVALFAILGPSRSEPEGRPVDSIRFAPGLAVCWAPPASGGSPPPLAPGVLPATVDPTLRWSSTTLGGMNTTLGDPTVITYSFVPDGTNAPSGTGEAAAPSELFSWLDAVFGSTAAWQQIFHEEFARWGEVCGIDYVFEPNDDGATLYTTAGAPGLRGDVRIAAKPIDGLANILAFNFLPPFGGDMVLDSSDGFLSTLSNDARALRNTISHEHGHGLGLGHVCPTNGQKLMEPIITLGLLGPAIDDRRGAQRFYGDRFEPNDNASSAEDLGPLPDTTTSIEGVSTDDNSDEDWYRFTAAPGRQLTVTLTPQGGTYLEGPQNPDGSCTAGTLTDASAISDLAFELIASDGTTVLASTNAAGAGATEQLTLFSLPSGGDYFLRVFPDATNDLQLYDLDLQLIAPVPPFIVVIPTAPPLSVAPETATKITVVVISGSTALDINASRLRCRSDGAAYLSFNSLRSLGGGFIEVTLPPLAPYEELEWYLELAGQDGSLVYEPSFGPSAPRTIRSEPDPAMEIVVFDDDFTSDLGWTVMNGSGLTAGAWERGVPAGGGLRGDPAQSSDSDGFCYLTANFPGNSDVDGGSTTLLSPLFDLSGIVDARIEYAFWFDNDEGSNPNSKSFDFEVSADGGGSWIRIETFTGSPGLWQARSLRLRDFVSPTAQVQFRAIVDDSINPSVLEAGFDDFRITALPLNGLGPWAAGYVDDGQGGRLNLLSIDGDAGGPSRRVLRSIGQPFAFQVASIPGALLPTQFAIFGRLGAATADERFLIDPEVGVASFVPCPLWPTNPFLFTLADGIGLGASCPGVLPAGPTPWAFGLPLGLPGPLELTFQVAVLNGSTARMGNALVLEIQ